MYPRCAHHDYSDLKTCNMDLPCSVIQTIANDPEFRLLTALLYIRSSDPLRKRLTARLSYNEDKSTAKLANLDSRRNSTKYLGALPPVLQDDKPDLGLLAYHESRLTAAAEALGWRGMKTLDDSETFINLLKDALDSHLQNLTPVPQATLESRKIVFMLSKSGQISVKSTVIGNEKIADSKSLLTRKFIPDSLDDATGFDTFNCKVYLDLQPSRPSTLTSQKTSHRCVFTSARERLDILPEIAPTSQEVLLYNPYGEVTEASCSTVYFKRDGVWITPAAICGSMLGVTRRLAVEKGLCKQGIIELKDLKANEEIWLSNAVRGFFRGTLMSNAQTLRNSANSEEVNLAKLGASSSLNRGLGEP